MPADYRDRDRMRCRFRVGSLGCDSRPWTCWRIHKLQQRCEAKIPLRCSPFGLQFSPVIESFADPLTEKIFRGDDLTRKETRQMGDLRIDKAQERLLILHHSAETDHLNLHSLQYHKLHGTGRYSIDANSRSSKWRITFAWADQALTDVSFVKIEDTH